MFDIKMVFNHVRGGFWTKIEQNDDSYRDNMIGRGDTELEALNNTIIILKKSLKTLQEQKQKLKKGEIETMVTGAKWYLQAMRRYNGEQ